MKKRMMALLAGLLLAPALAAAQQGGIELKSVAEVEVVQKDAQGAKVVKRVEASKANVVPGDPVIFTISYLNTGAQPATDVVLRNPVPEHMIYQDRSATGEGSRIEYSIDHGKSFAPLEQLTVKSAAGKERGAGAADVTDIRWTLLKPVPPGGTGSVSFRAKVK